MFQEGLYHTVAESRVSFCVCASPGCPPLQGSEGGEQNFMGVLETALKLANQDTDGDAEEEDGQREAAKVRRKKTNNKGLTKWSSYHAAKQSDWLPLNQG